MIVSQFEIPSWRGAARRPAVLDATISTTGQKHRIDSYALSNISGTLGTVTATVSLPDGRTAARFTVVDGVVTSTDVLVRNAEVEVLTERVVDGVRRQVDQIVGLGTHWTWVNPDGVMSTEERRRFERDTQTVHPVTGREEPFNTIVAEQTAQTTSANTATTTATLGTDPAVGHLLVAYGASRPQDFSGAAPTQSIDVTAGTFAEDSTAVTSNHRIGLYSRVVDSASGHTNVTLTPSHTDTTFSHAAQVWEYSGISGWTLDKESNNNNTGSTSSIATGSTGPVNTGDLVVSAGTIRVNGTMSDDSSLTLGTNHEPGNPHFASRAGWAEAPTTTAWDVTWSQSKSAQAAACITAYTVAAGDTVIGLAAETDAALSIESTKTVDVAATSETDAALAVTGAKAASVGLASQTDTALPMFVAKAASVGLASQTDAALPMSVAKVVPAGLAVETDTPLAMSVAKAVPVGLVTETDTPLAVSAPTGLGIVTETDTALAMTVAKARSVGFASTSGQPLTMSVAKGAPIGLVTEADAPLAVTSAKALPIALASETDALLGFTAAKSLTVGQATETSTVLALSAAKVLALALVAETDAVFAMSGGDPVVLSTDRMVTVRAETRTTTVEADTRTTTIAAESRTLTVEAP